MTLIEVVVAMVVMMIVLAMASRLLADGAASKDSITNDATATMAADQTSDQIASDLRAAYHPGRRNATDDDIARGSHDGVDIREIVTAEPHVLQVRADADPRTSGIECTSYRVDAQGSLWRTVTSDVAGCGDAGTTDVKRVLPGLHAKNASGTPDPSQLGAELRYVPGAGAPPPAVTFTYIVAMPNPAAPGQCVRQELPTVIGAATSRIIGVKIDVKPVVQSRNDVATTSFTTSVSLRSRAGSSYRRAIGCSYGVA